MADLDRDIAKFYEKIHPDVQHLASTSKPDGRNRISGAADNTKEAKIFGRVTKEHMESILGNYEQQQNDAAMSNKPVICDAIKGGSYAKMLYSDPNFHHLGSTDYLVKELGIDEHKRSSFLGGYNTFAVSNSEDLDGLRRKYQIENTKRVLQIAYAEMNQQHWSESKALIEQAFKIDHKSGFAMLAMGEYYNRLREFDKAIPVLKQALNCDDGVNKKEVRITLSNSLYELGFYKYQIRDWAKAVDYIRQALDADPDNENAKLHLPICENKLQIEMNNRHSFRHQSQYHYRK